MATREHQQHEASSAEKPVLTYLCPKHATFFPSEEPRRPYTEFAHDPVTLRRTHGSSCKRCANEMKRAYTLRKSNWREVPPVERVREAIVDAEKMLRRVETGGGDGKVTAEGLRWQLDHLHAQLRDLEFQAGGDDDARNR